MAALASLGAPLLLISLAGNGWLRGVQELRRPVRYVLAGSLLSLVLCPLLVYPAGVGLVGSAVANVAGQALTAALFVRALLREDADWRPRPAAIGSQLSSAATCCCAPRSCSSPSWWRPASPPAPAPPRWAPTRSRCSCSSSSPWCSTRTRSPRRRSSGTRSAGPAGRGPATAVRVALGTGHRRARGRVLLAPRDLLLPLFTGDAAVLAQAELVWWFLAAMQPLAGVVFALDGVLMVPGTSAISAR